MQAEAANAETATGATCAPVTGKLFGGMTLKERFRRTMFFQDVPVRPNFEFGYWDRTLEVWREQGMPDWVVDEATAYDYFGIENVRMLAVGPGALPVCEYAVLEETDDYIVYRDEMGCVAQQNKHGDHTIPHYIEYPIRDRETWEGFKHALDPDRPERWASFEASLRELENCDAPVGIDCGSLLGIPRNLIGFENIATLPYEDPELIRDIVDTFGRTVVAVLERALPRIQVDFGHGWEDICYNQGPILNPDFIREAAGPWYRRIADTLVAHGCCVYSTDTDGNIMPIVEIFLDNGLNTMFPVEVHGGSDPRVLRERYGKRVRLWGGVNKRALAATPEDIRREMLSLKPYVEQGGFIPTVDHRVPTDVSFDNYRTYLDLKREILHVGGEPKY